MFPASDPVTTSRLFARWAVAFLVLLVAVLVACSGPELVEERLPLVSGRQLPLVLTESADVSVPPSLDGNRLVRGWWRYKRRGELRLGLLENARLQGVNLAGAPRRLILDGEKGDSGQVEYRFSGGEWQQVELTPKLRIPVPTDLPIGRFAVDLKVTGGGAFAALVHDAVSKREGAAAGDLEIDSEAAYRQIRAAPES